MNDFKNMRWLFVVFAVVLILIPAISFASGAGDTSIESIDGLANQFLGGSVSDSIARSALNYVGSPYSQELRGTGNYMDCSSFVQRSLGDVGIEVPGTSVEQGEFCLANEWIVDRDAAMAGDLVFWSKVNCECGRTHEIHHVGIYLGNERVAEASSLEGQVVVRRLWETSSWNITFFARPYNT